MNIDFSTFSFKDYLYSCDVCKVGVYYSNPLVLLFRAKRDLVTLARYRDSLLVVPKSKFPTLYPYFNSSAKEYVTDMIEAIEEFGGLANVVHHYANPLSSRYKVIPMPWGNLQFVYDARRLINMEGISGSSARRLRKLREGGLEVSDITIRDVPACTAVFDTWSENYYDKGVMEQGGVRPQGQDLSRYLKLNDEVLHKAGFIAIKVSKGGRVLGFSVASKVSESVGCFLYGYNIGEVPNLDLLLMSEIASRMVQQGVIHITDGTAGAVDSGLYKYKAKFTLGVPQVTTHIISRK